jgi:hypothetical protein
VATLPTQPIAGNIVTPIQTGPYVTSPISSLQYTLGSIPGSNISQYNSNGNTTINGNQNISGNTTTSTLNINTPQGIPIEILGRSGSGDIGRVSLGSGLTLSG